ncbi:hypothetical protein EV421DRAFT_1503991 [Armillaria borealis]|uniref:Uncharacterized protein n=1 Tax=Armillaria borealis TaxID=47425 RepID=A0AA39IYY3_9AGAR|nr:hypothetical protein EV421DRAFT_1503991 [Armillaria borealis]
MIHQPFYVCLDTPPVRPLPSLPFSYNSQNRTTALATAQKYTAASSTLSQYPCQTVCCTKSSLGGLACSRSSRATGRGLQIQPTRLHWSEWNYRCRLSCQRISSAYIRIPLICKHRRGMTFYELAYSISADYRDIFRREAEKVSPGRTAPMTHVVMNVNNLRLGSLYTDDPSKTRWWAEVVLIDAL